VLGRPQPYDAFALARRHGRGKDLEEVIAFHAEFLTGTPQTAAWRARIRGGIEPGVRGGDARARRAVALILASPEMLLA
jgi:hypothetical protein